MKDTLPQLFFGTHNAHKLREVADLVQGRYLLLGAADFPHVAEAPETGRTLEANALQKAQYYRQHTGLACFADDSGLEVDVLEGAPGVDSAHFSGSRDAAANLARLLHEMGTSPQRAARFRTVIAYAMASGPVHLFTGELRGEITLAPRGSNGFGYDPVFVPEGHTRTLAELSPADKNAISHRSRALAAFLHHLSTHA